ncbi:hypothetical protein Mapa_009352 [Marchantia paleacea]|nr:hypothetical protein Mapa_009352 [Marchantia paleacea]
MSKKKVASRSAMTLKDFHGGSIPSDLPLPSAPGMTVDRSAYERQGSGTWMSPTLGRGYGGDRGGYSRQGSSNAVRTFEDKASYFPNPANIGRNYDEDERKPVDGRPRSSHSSDRYDDHGYEERRGGFSMDRYSLEDQGSFASAPGSYVEARGLGSSDRFPPSQVAGVGFESDNYVHDEFGLIPVGPPPARMTREIPLRQQPSYQRELIQTPPEQHPYDQSPPTSSLLPYATQQQQLASSPPRSWRNPSHQSAPVSGTRTQQEPAAPANVWTARREGEFTRAPATESPSEPITSTPWRSQGSAAKISEASAVEKVSSGRWQSDATRPCMTTDRRPQGSHLTPEGASDEPILQNVYGSDYVEQSPYSGAQPTDAVQGAYDDAGRVGPVGVKRTSFSQAGRGETLDRAGYVEDRGTGRSSFPDAGARAGYGLDTARRSYPEERWTGTGTGTGGFSETERCSNADIEGIAHPETGRGGYSDPGRTKGESNRAPYAEVGRGAQVESERVEVSEQSRPGFTESSRYGFGSSGRGGFSSVERGSQYETGRGGYSDRSRYHDDGEGSFSQESGQVMYTENGRSSYAPEGGATAYSREETRGGYGSDGNRASYGDRERSRSPYTLDRAGAVSPDIARSPAAEVWRSGPIDPTRTAPGTKPEPSERPKLKLLPRTKPLEKETSNVSNEDVGGSEKGVEFRYLEEKRPAEILSLETFSEQSTELGTNNPLSESNDETNRKVERPKLNLKPRTHPTEVEPVEGSQKVRQVVFGGARPRELVLKERGVDDPLATAEASQTPLSASVQSSTPNSAKPERADVVRVERQESWGEEKPEGRRYERPDRGFDRQVSNRQEGNRGEREFERKDSRRDQERLETRRNPERYENRREPDRPEPRRDADGRRDIDKQDSWRRPAESPVVASIGPRNPSSTVSSLVDPSPRSLGGGKYGYSATASAVELAQAFSRSSSIGSTMTGAARGANSLRSPLSPIPKSSGQGYGPGYGNGLPSPYGPRDAPFSRLAEAPPPPPGSGRDMYQGGGFGGDGLSNGYASGKLGGYGGGDMKNSFGRGELSSGREREEFDDLPGKRGLPIRQKEGYYD